MHFPNVTRTAFRFNTRHKWTVLIAAAFCVALFSIIEAGMCRAGNVNVHKLLSVSSKAEDLEKSFDAYITYRDDGAKVTDPQSKYESLSGATIDMVVVRKDAVSKAVNGLPATYQKSLNPYLKEVAKYVQVLQTRQSISDNEEWMLRNAIDQLHQHNQQATELLAQSSTRSLFAYLSFTLFSFLVLGAFAARLTYLSNRSARLDAQVARLKSAQLEAHASMAEEALSAFRGFHEPSDAVESAAAIILKHSDWILAHVWLPDGEGNWISTRKWYGETQLEQQFQRVSEHEVIESGRDIPGEAADQMTSIWVEDAANYSNSRRLRICTESQIQSLLAVPIIFEGRTQAILEFADTVARPCDVRLLETINNIARHLGLEFERYSQELLIERQSEELDAQRNEMALQLQVIEEQQGSLDVQVAALAAFQTELQHKESKLAETFDDLKRASQHAQIARDLHETVAKRFEELFNGVPVACFTTDLNGVIYEWNQCASEFWQVQGFEVLEHSLFEVIALESTKDVLANVLQSVLQGEVAEQFEIATANSEGVQLHALASVFPIRGRDGTVTGSVWAFVDHTDRKHQEDLLRVSEARFRTSLEAMQNGVMLIDHDGTLRMMNPRGAEILGWDFEALRTSPDRFDCLRPITLDEVRISNDELPSSRSLLHGERCRDQIYGVRRRDGRVVWTSVNSAPVQDPEGSQGVVMSFVDISHQLENEAMIRQSMNQVQQYSQALENKTEQLAAANKRLETMATEDGLTGVKNHRAFQEFLESQFQKSKRFEDPLSVIILDVDHFKQYNDKFGHPAGDEILRKLAEVISKASRTSDFVARYGGEEFGIVLPGTDFAGALEAGERIREAVSKAKWPNRSITVSVGCATMRKGIKSRTDLVNEADRALYASKDSGRNCVKHFDQLNAAA